jgi:hypothetical protein
MKEERLSCRGETLHLRMSSRLDSFPEHQTPACGTCFVDPGEDCQRVRLQTPEGFLILCARAVVMASSFSILKAQHRPRTFYRISIEQRSPTKHPLRLYSLSRRPSHTWLACKHKHIIGPDQSIDRSSLKGQMKSDKFKKIDPHLARVHRKKRASKMAAVPNDRNAAAGSTPSCRMAGCFVFSDPRQNLGKQLPPAIRAI